MSRQTIAVDCRPDAAGWSCIVTVGDDPAATRHVVEVTRDVLGRLRPTADAPEQLVRDSFAFLLEREARESILGSFDLPLIGRYFPEWEAAVRRSAG
jgi:hypothetical protein